MAATGSRIVILTTIAVVLVGALAGLAGALVFKKMPVKWLRQEKQDTHAGTEPESLFYKTIGDSPALADQDSAGNGNQDGLPENKFTIEIAKMTSREQAESMIKSLAQRGLDAYYTPLLKDGRVIYRVRYGMFDTESNAKSAMKSLQTKLGLKTTVSRM
jgi:hypothetical protein